MKKILVSAVLMLAFTVCIVAQESQKPRGGEDKGKAMLEKLKQELVLTDSQAMKVEVIARNYMKKRQKEMMNSEDTVMRDLKIKELNLKLTEDLKVVLTSEQIEKFKVLMMERMKKMRSNSGRQEPKNE